MGGWVCGEGMGNGRGGVRAWEWEGGCEGMGNGRVGLRAWGMGGWV